MQGAALDDDYSLYDGLDLQPADNGDASIEDGAKGEKLIYVIC